MRKVSIQGIEASFHDQAAKAFFGKDIKIIPARSFRESCENLICGKADYAVMAIENSIAGPLIPNYSLINEYNLKLIGEQYLTIELHLMGLNGIRMNEIEQIHSHPVALEQCNKFLMQYPDIKIVAMNTTAECAQHVSVNHLERVAVIAGQECADRFGMTILRRNIESVKNNYTRFVILSTEVMVAQKADKGSASFHINNLKTLEKIIRILRNHSIKLLSLHPVSLIGKPNDHIIHIDFEYSKQKNLKEMLNKLRVKTSDLKFYGSYSKQKLKAET